MITVQQKKITPEQLAVKTGTNKHLFIKETNLTVLPNLPLLESLRCTHSPLRDIQVFNNLVTLNISATDVTVLPYMPNLTNLHIGSTKIKSIDDRYRSQLVILEISDTNCSISGIWTKLEHLYADNCSLTELYGYNFPRLLYLGCSSNSISELDGFVCLQELIADNNKLTQISNFPVLQKASVPNNKLTQMPYISSLTFLDCSYNSIPYIRVPFNMAKLYISHNMLREIDISPELKELDVSFNLIKKLDASKLTEVRIHMNPIDEIYLSKKLKMLTLNLYQYQQIVSDELHEKITHLGFTLLWEVIVNMKPELNTEKLRIFFKKELNHTNYVELIRHNFSNDWKNICHIFQMAYCLELLFN